MHWLLLWCHCQFTEPESLCSWSCTVQHANTTYTGHAGMQHNMHHNVRRVQTSSYVSACPFFQAHLTIGVHDNCQGYNNEYDICYNSYVSDCPRFWANLTIAVCSQYATATPMVVSGDPPSMGQATTHGKYSTECVRSRVYRQGPGLSGLAVGL